MKECVFYKKLDKSLVQCLACNHKCKIPDGKTGICGVRQNIDGKLQLLVYGKAIAVNIDPVEKKPLFHFLPGSFAYSFGTIGCNFRCANCQNWDISQMFEHKGKIEDYVRLNWGTAYSPEDHVKLAKENDCKSIAYTYNEPTIFAEYMLDTMKLAKKAGLKNIWVSNGFMSDETLDAIIPYLDAINVDIKSFDDGFYKSMLGGRVQPVLDNCKRFIKAKVWLEVTSLVIPTLSDDMDMLRNVARFIKKELGDFVPWHVSAFCGSISWKLKHLPDTPVTTIQQAYEIGKKEGLKNVYAGNVWDPQTESTYCPKCKQVVIKRISYQIDDQTDNGKCRNCKTKINGVFT